jgi:hypothetical protein
MKWCAVWMICLLALTSAAEPASRRQQIIRELTQEYATYVKAFADKEIGPIQAQLDPGWSGRIGGQTLSRAQLVRMTEDAMDATRSVQDMCITIRNVHIKGNVVTATVMDTASLVVWNEDRTATRTLASKNLRRDTWVRTSAGWRLRRSEVLRTY